SSSSCLTCFSSPAGDRGGTVPGTVTVGSSTRSRYWPFRWQGCSQGRRIDCGSWRQQGAPLLWSWYSFRPFATGISPTTGEEPQCDSSSSEAEVWYVVYGMWLHDCCFSPL